MQLSSKAQKAVAAGLAASTILWAAAGIMPQIASAAVHSEGCLVLSGGIVWMITNGTRRGYTSAEVFQSYGYNFSQVVNATAEDVALPVGPIMIYADGTLVKGPNDPLVYLVAGMTKRPFTSGAVFTGLGYKFSNIQSAPYNTFADLPTGPDLNTTQMPHPKGTKVISNGAIWLMDDNGRMGFPSAANFLGYGYKFANVVQANSYDLSSQNLGDVPARPTCMLTGSPTPTPTPGPTPTPPSGSMTVTLSSDNPAARSVVTSEAGADLAHFTFWGTGTVTSVTLKRLGISQDSSLSSVYLYDGATRLTDAASVSNGSMITFNDPNGLFTVNGSKTISVRADMAASSGETVGVQLVSALVGSVAFSGTPISGNLFTIASATLAGVTFGTVTPAANSSLTPDKDVIVWQSTATVVTRDVWLTRFAIREVGGINKTDLANLRLMVDGNVVGTVGNPDSNGYVTFVPSSPYKLITGAHVFKVVADVLGGSSLSFTFSIRNKTDIGLVDSQYNVGFLTGTAVGSLTGFQQTIATGYITVQKATDSPSSTIVLSGTDVVLGRFTATTYGENVKVDSLLVDFTSTATATLRNGRVLIDGAQVGSTATISPASTGTTFNINKTFMAGTTSVIEVRADVFDNDGTGAFVAGDTLKVTLSTGVNNGQGMVSGDASLDVPTANVDANTLTVGSGSMVLAKDQAYGNQTIVVPSTKTLLGSWTLTSGTSEAINLDTIQVDFTTADDFAPADLTNVYVMYGSKMTSTKATVAATSGTTSVGNSWSISETLPVNSSMTFKVYGDVASGAVSTTTVADTVIPSLLVSGTTVSGTAVNTNSNAVLSGQTITAVNSGVLTVSLDTNTPVAAQVVAGTTDSNGALKVKLAGTNEDQYIKKLTVYVDTSSNTAAISSLNLSWSATSNGTYATVGTDQTIVNDGTLPGYATWNLSGGSRVLVAKNASVYLKVTPTYVSSGQTAVTGKTPKLFLGNLEAEGTSVLSAGGPGSGLVNTTGIVVKANDSATYVDSTEDTATTAQPATTTVAGAAATDASYLTTANGIAFSAGDIIFIDENADATFDPATEDLQVVLSDGGAVLRVARGVFGMTAQAHTTGKNIYRLSGLVATYTNAGIVGNAQTVLNTKLGVALKADSPSGATTGGTGKYVFGVTVSAANNSADPATNTATITSMDITANKSAATVSNLKAYPAEYDQNATYATTCGAISSTKWRCVMSTTGSTNQVDENSSRSYVFRADVGFSGAGSVDFSLASLGTSSSSSNSVTWSDGTTSQTWVNQASTVVQGGSLTTTAASGTADTTAPTITDITITDGTADDALTVGATIAITFSEPMDASTIGSATLVPGGSAVAVVDSATGDISGVTAGTDLIRIKNIIDIGLGNTTAITGAPTGAVTAQLNSSSTVLTLTVTSALTLDAADGTESIIASSAATTMKDANGVAATAAGSDGATINSINL